jgi:ferredoxin
MSQVDRKQLGMLHRYPALARLSDGERRSILLRETGSATSKGLTQEQFERAMAAFEAALWQRVDAGIVPDPRLCPVCGRPLQATHSCHGACPEGCVAAANVTAWTRDHWRKKVISAGFSNSRQTWKLRRYWEMLCDYLPESKRLDVYLAAIVAQSVSASPGERASIMRRLSSCGSFDWSALTARECHCAIEAVKDRLSHSVP